MNMPAAISNRPSMPPQMLVNAYCKLRRIGVADLLNGATKTRAITMPRHELMYLLRELTPLSFDAIGKVMGGRDISTVMSGVKNISERILADADYSAQMDQIRAYLLAYTPPQEGGARDAATVLARRVLAEHGGHPADATALAVVMVSIAAVLRSPDLTDAEARQATLSILSNGGGAA